MESIDAFFSMGGYAVFVWPSYLLTGAVLVGLLALSLRSSRTSERTLAKLKNRTRKESEPHAPKT